jgi:hypothetical protein
MDDSSSFKEASSSPLMDSCLHRRLGESAIISLARRVRNSDNQRTAREEYEPSEDRGTIDESINVIVLLAETTVGVSENGKT